MYIVQFVNEYAVENLINECYKEKQGESCMNDPGMVENFVNQSINELSLWIAKL